MTGRRLSVYWLACTGWIDAWTDYRWRTNHVRKLAVGIFAPDHRCRCYSLFVRYVTPNPLSETRSSLDKGGTVLSIVGATSLVTGFLLSGKYGWLVGRRPFSVGEMQFNPFGTSPAIWFLGVGLLVLAAFVQYERRMERAGKSPLVPLHVLTNRPFGRCYHVQYSLDSLGRLHVYLPRSISRQYSDTPPSKLGSRCCRILLRRSSLRRLRSAGGSTSRQRRSSRSVSCVWALDCWCCTSRQAPVRRSARCLFQWRFTEPVSDSLWHRSAI